MAVRGSFVAWEPLGTLLPEARDLAAAGEDEEAGGLEEGFQGYSAAFAKLANAQAPVVDPVPQVKDPGLFLAQKLQGLSQVRFFFSKE